MSASNIANQRLARQAKKEALGKSAVNDEFAVPDLGPYATEYTHQYNLRTHTKGIDLMPEANDFPGRMSRMVPVSRYDFRDKTRGIVPGYRGHIPTTKDVISTSPFGGWTKDIVDPKPADPRDILTRGQTVSGERPGSPERPKRQDGRGIVPGSTYHVHQERYEVGISTCSDPMIPDMPAGVIHR